VALSPGTELGRYVVSEMIGSGGMGEVYKAYDPHLGRHVAIKLLPGDLAKHPEFQRRFERETRAISGLNHKNICTIYDTGQHDGQPYIVMELMEGQTLESLVRSGHLPPDRALDIGIQVADALDAAHRKGIVHRDIKSANIFLTARDDAKVLDFGVAKLMASADTERDEADTALTGVGTAVGTVSYMSPEQARGEDVDARSDLFSLGVVLYQMVTGRLPFEGSAVAILSQLSTGQSVGSPLTLNPSLPAEFDRIIGRVLEKDKEVRCQTAKDLLAALRRLRRDQVSGETAAGHKTVADGAQPTHRRRLREIVLTVALIVSIATVAVLGLLMRRSAVPLNIQSIAVLPCSSQSGEADIEYLCDVFGESLIASMSQIPGLVVMSFPIVEPYKGSDMSVLDIGRQLNVDAVVTTQVDEQIEALEFAVRVTDVRNGAHIWSDRITSPIAQIQGLHEAIALDVAENLQMRLSGRQREHLRVYNTYQRALYFWNKRTSESLARAITLFEDVIREEPEFAPAHAGLASAYVVLPYYGGLPGEAYPRARRAAEEALRLDEGLADAHASLGLVKRDFERDWLGAEREFRRAIELDSASGSALQWYAEFLAMVSRFDEAEAWIRQAQQVSPLSLTARAVHGWILLCAGRTDEALRQLGATLDMDPDFSVTHWFLGQLHVQRRDYDAAVEALEEASRLSGGASRMVADLGSAYALRGDRDRARALLDRLRELSSQGVHVSRYEYSVVHAGLGEFDQAIRELEAALEERTWQVVNMNIDPMLRPVRDDPRYPGLVRRMGLPGR
jgi:serine/threonine protein kinase/tetratricopeptide (TPR) repeat protein